MSEQPEDLPGAERGQGADPEARMKRPDWDKVPNMGGLLKPYEDMLKKRESDREKGILSLYDQHKQLEASCTPEKISCDGSGRIIIGRHFPHPCEAKGRHCSVGRNEYVLKCQEYIKGIGKGGKYLRACFDHPQYIADSDLSRRAMRYAEGGEYQEGASLLIKGDTGPGKTFNCLAILAHLYATLGVRGVFHSVPLLLNWHSGQREEVDAAMQAKILVLDDLGTETAKDNSESYLLSIIDSRLGAGLPTIITTNMLMPDLIQRYPNGRILDRLREYDFFETKETSKR